MPPYADRDSGRLGGPPGIANQGIGRGPGGLPYLSMEPLPAAPLLLSVIVLGVFLKWLIMIQAEYREQFVGLSKAMLFRSDPLRFLVILPFCFAGALKLVGVRAGDSLLSLSLLLWLLFAVQAQSVDTLGRLSSLYTRLEGVHWARQDLPTLAALEQLEGVWTGRLTSPTAGTGEPPR